MNKYLNHIPSIIFAICVVIALLLTLMAPSLWPAALAIAIAGGALAMAFRSDDSREIEYLTDDITVLQEQNAALKSQMAEFKTELIKNNEMIDELADIVEQVATLSADGGDITKAEVEALRGELSDVRAQSKKTQDVAPSDPVKDSRVDDLEFRLAALEAQSVQKVTSNATTRDLMASDTMTGDMTASDAALGLTAATTATAATTMVSASDVGSLRSLMARVNGDTAAAHQDSSIETPPEPDPVEPETNATLAPVFQPNLGEPVAFILRPSGDDVPNRFPGILNHAIKIATELEEAKRENLLFVGLSSLTLADVSVRDAILTAVAQYPALQRRLILLTGQPDFSNAALQNLTQVAAEGCRFGLYDVRDWSINLAALARDGMAFILVDGPAMARSAQDQAGDPKRLTQALGMHDISLIAGDVTTEADIQSTMRLEPSFVTGTGLGETRALEVTA